MKDTVWKIGEAAAKEYLENNGYQIIEQNYQTKYSEIDLIV
ncbi:YraN family protein, partial [Patescibacteria group bacterium]|nr:YraN family protein [Patescibacteria group bacterium]